jgi:hypothetical protein
MNNNAFLFALAMAGFALSFRPAESPTLNQHQEQTEPSQHSAIRWEFDTHG